jgi:hypothetical protein
MIDDISKHFQKQFLVKSLGRVTQVVISFAQSPPPRQYPIGTPNHFLKILVENPKTKALPLSNGHSNRP